MDNWERAAGVECPQCHQEAFQIVKGVCARCHKAKVGETEEVLEDRAERRYLKDRLREGTISLDQLRDPDQDS